MKPTTSIFAGSALVFLSILTACDDGDTQGAGMIIRALVDPETVVAGSDVTATCVAVPADAADDAEGQPVPDATIAVTPKDGIKIEGMKIGTSRTGCFSVECKSEKLSKAGSEPAPFTVTPGDPVKTVASVDPENTTAAEKATVTCVIEDAFGNPVTGYESAPEPLKDLDIEGNQVGSDVAGAYEITCSAPEGFPDVQKTPAILQVSPGRPVSLEMKLTPDKKNYAIKDSITVSWVVADAWGNQITDLEAGITVDPADGLPLKGTKLTVKQEGTWTVTVALKDFDLSDSAVVVCDASAPVLEIEWPPRGASIDGSPEVEIRGRVTDAAGSDVTVDVNGKAATVDAEGRFTLPYTSVHGLNGLKITARDSLKHELWTTRGYYWSQDWTPVDGETTMADMVRNDGAMLFLGQKFLDDGNHDRSHPNDLATIVEILLASGVGGLLDSIPPISIPIPNIINLTLLGIGLQGDLEIVVQVTDVSFGDPYVGITTRDGGLATEVTLQPVYVSLDLKFVLHARAVAFGNTYQLLDPQTTSGSSMEVGKFLVGLSLDIQKLPGQDMTVEGRDFKLDIDDIQLDPISHLEIDLGVVPGLGINLGKIDLTRIVGSIDDLLANYVVEPLLNFLIPPLTDLLEPLVTNLIGDALESLFGMLVLNQTVEIPALSGGGEPVPLDLSLAPSTVVFTADGGTVGLELGFLTDNDVGHTPIGVIGSLTADGNSTFAFNKDPGVQAAFDIQTVNTLLFMLWQSGLLKGQIDLSSLLGSGGGLPVENLKITPDLYLPPIINDRGITEEGGMMSIEIGDAYLKVQVDVIGNPQFFDLWVQLAAEVQVVARGSEIGVKIGKVTFFQAEFVNLGDLEDLFGMFLPSIPDLVKGLEGQELTFPIPEIDLGSIIPGLGGPAPVQLGNGLSEVRDGTVVFGMDLL